MKISPGPVLEALLGAGFDAVYDDPTYKTLKGIYDGPKWANDLDAAASSPIFHRALRYAENHDEVRLAGAGQWGSVGMPVGRAATAILFALGRGPVLLYSGQEVGEPAAGIAGFGGGHARTTIFDYWSMPELLKWVNGHAYDGGRLSTGQRELRAFYGRLLRLVGEPAFSQGEFFALNPANRDHPGFGRLPGESSSGHWLYAFLRRDAGSGQCFLVVANLHPSETLAAVRMAIPARVESWLDGRCALVERLMARAPRRLERAVRPAPREVALESIPPLTPLFFEVVQ
jgi:hypothetical protein